MTCLALPQAWRSSYLRDRVDFMSNALASYVKQNSIPRPHLDTSWWTWLPVCLGGARRTEKRTNLGDGATE